VRRYLVLWCNCKWVCSNVLCVFGSVGVSVGTPIAFVSYVRVCIRGIYAMSSSVTINDSISAAVSCDVLPDPKAYSSAGSCESKPAFADTAPLAKIREELKSNEADSTEVPAESEVSSEPVLGYEPPPEGPTTSSEGSERPPDGEPAEIGSEQVVGRTMTLDAEVPVVQGAPAIVMPPGVGHEDARSETLIMEQPVVAHPQAAPMPTEATVGGSLEVGDSQGVIKAGVTVVPEGVAQPDAIRSSVEDSVDMAKPVPIQGGQDAGISQGKADAVVAATTQGNTGNVSVDAGPAAEREPATESAVGVVGPSETGATAVEPTEVVVKNPTQALEPTLSGEAQAASPEAADPENGTLPALVPEKVEKDLGNTHLAGEKVSAQAGTTVQTQDEMQDAATDGQTKGGRFFDAKDGMKPQAEVLDIAQDPAAASAERLAPRSASASGMGGDASAVKGPVQDVGAQILGSVQASLARGDRQILVRLDPPELGSVVVRFQEQGNQVSGVLEVGRDETRREIEQALPQVLRSLQEAGVQVRRLEVADQATRDLDREQMQQDAWAQREGSDQQGEHPERPSHGWSALRGPQQGFFGQSDAIESPTDAGQGRINMLI